MPYARKVNVDKSPTNGRRRLRREIRAWAYLLAVGVVVAWAGIFAVNFYRSPEYCPSTSWHWYGPDCQAETSSAAEEAATTTTGRTELDEIAAAAAELRTALDQLTDPAEQERLRDARRAWERQLVLSMELYLVASVASGDLPGGECRVGNTGVGVDCMSWEVANDELEEALHFGFCPEHLIEYGCPATVTRGE